MKKAILLAIDIGNTSISAGLFAGSSLCKKVTIPSSAKKGVIHKELKNLILARNGCDSRAIVSSVVPCVTETVKNILIKKLTLNPVIIGEKVKVPIKNLYKSPAQVGQDRLVNAYACKEIYGKPAIVIDFGTATTFDYINKKGEYEGGIITPGVEITINALAEKTALLPRIKLKTPKNLIGKDTIDSIRSGVVYGLASMCDGLVEKIKKQKKSSPLIIATGGLAGIFCHYSKHINKIDQDLTLKGLYLIFSKKKAPALDI
jgi:type III pantothenate kinase